MENDTSFLPNGYEVPEADSNYYKIVDGANTFRVLSSAIVGYLYWNDVNKPVRSREAFDELPHDIRIGKDGKPDRIKPFWAFLVWDYKAKKVKIMELTQKTIMAPFKALVENPKWGDPKSYDITITRSGEGLDTEYSVMPEPHSEMPIAQVPHIDLSVLYEGGDPFAKEPA